VTDNSTGAPHRVGERPRRTAWKICDLRTPGGWEKAREEREAWGRHLSEVHTLGHDHVIIVFRDSPGGEGEAA
jgi:hypothetical protein